MLTMAKSETYRRDSKEYMVRMKALYHRKIVNNYKREKLESKNSEQTMLVYHWKQQAV